MKKVKKTEKHGRENQFLLVKKSKMSPKKGFHAHFFFHAQKKNTENSRANKAVKIKF